MYMYVYIYVYVCVYVCVCIYSADMPNTVKNSKNYSQLMLTTCFDTTFNMNHFIKSSMTF